MEAEGRVLLLDFGQGGADAHGDRRAGALGWITRPARAPAEAVGPSQFAGDHVELGARALGTSQIGEPFGLFQLLAQLCQAGRDTPVAPGRRVPRRS